MVIRDRNEEAAAIGGPKKKGENNKSGSDRQNTFQATERRMRSHFADDKCKGLSIKSISDGR